MAHASYVFLRRDTGSYFFRWTIPATVRPLLGGRAELKRSLHTDQRRVALRLARRLSVVLERATAQLMAANLTQQLETQQLETHPANLIVKSFERLVDGTLRIEGLELDPKHAEQDKQLLAALFGTAGATATSPDQRKLSDLVEAFFEDGKRGNKWTTKTFQEIDSIYKLMLEILGKDKLLNSLSRKDFAYLKDVLSRLPSNRSKNPAYRGKGALELAAMKIPPEQLLGVTTINKILGWVSSLMGWGQLHGYVASNFCEGLAMAKAKRDDEHREPYTDAEAQTLKDAVLSGAHGVRSPWQKWIPLLLMFQGMRVNEAAQLACADFAEIDGIPVVTVTDEDGRRVKTSAARRTIPLHPELIRLGLLDHIEALRKKGVVRAWPEVHGGRDGHGQAVSRWYARYREKLGISKDAHSLRHSVIDRLREAGTPEDLVGDIVGHRRSGKVTFGTYAKSASIRRMLEALSRLSYEGKQPTPLRLVA